MIIIIYLIINNVNQNSNNRLQSLDLKEAAEFLHIHPITLLRMARSGKVPGAKPGKCWVFIDVDLADWLRAQYKPRASEGGLRNERKQKCHSSDAKTPRLGGLTSPSTGNAYSALLEQKTSNKRKNSTTA